MTRPSIWQDLQGGFAVHRFWRAWAWAELRAAYRRTLLGPIWIFLSFAIKLGAMVYVFSGVFGRPPARYLPYLTLGIASWGLLAGCIRATAASLIRSKSLILQRRRPVSLYFFKDLYKELLTFAPVWLFSLLLSLILQPAEFLPGLGWNLLGVLLIVLTALAMAGWLSILTVFFRDTVPLLGSALMLGFIMTPVLWPVSPAMASHPFVVLNPCHHLLQICRAPLLGEPLAGFSLLFAAGFLLVNALASSLVFAARSRAVPACL